MPNFVKYWALSEFVFLGKSNTPPLPPGLTPPPPARVKTTVWNTSYRRHSTQHGGATNLGNPFCDVTGATQHSCLSARHILIIEATFSSLVHHIDYTKNTSLAFHPVIPRHVSVTIEPRRRAQRARDGAPAHHEPSCLQGLDILF